MNHLILFLAPPIRDIFLSSCAGGPISTQSCFGSNPTKKKNLATTGSEQGKYYLKNNLSYLGWKTMQVILGHSSTFQSQQTEACCLPSALSPSAHSSFSLSSISQTLFPSCHKADYFWQGPIFTVSSAQHSSEPHTLQSEPAFTHSTHTNAVSSMTALFCQSEIAAVIFRLRWK